MNLNELTPQFIILLLFPEIMHKFKSGGKDIYKVTKDFNFLFMKES